MGAHVSFLKDKQLLGAVETFIQIKANSGAFYISNSRSFNKPWEIDSELTKKGIELAKQNNINIKNIIVHSPLVGNLANTEDETKIYEKTLISYVEDIKRMDKIGLKLFNIHPGSNADLNKGINRIIEGINKIHSLTPNSKIKILLETLPKKGNYIGKTFEELRMIIEGVKNKNRIGVCIDTCHIWDGGYDIKNDLDGILKKFNKTIGFEYLFGLHINDSKNELNSNKDRHELIGKGYIGLEALRKFVNHPKLVNIPKALETPLVENNINKWREEIKLLIK